MANSPFSKADIQKRVNEIRRSRGGLGGSPEADWQEAIRQLEADHTGTKGRRSIFSWLNRPFVLLERRAIEPTANWLDRADIFRIIEKISPIVEAVGVFAGAIIIPIVIWQVSDMEQEAKEQQEKAVRAQTAVQNYLNQLSDILATGKLKTDKDLQTIVRASTLALLENPDLQPDPELEDSDNRLKDRKGQTIGYLIETGLVQARETDRLQSNSRLKAVISLKDANLTAADLYKANLTGSDLDGANLKDAYLGHANLSNANLNRSNFYDANLDTANLSGTNLSNANLSNTILYATNLSEANLSKVNLKDSYFSEANFSGADLSNANFSSASALSANFSGANLSDANFSSTFALFANFNGANFNGTNLSDANFSNANNLTESQLDRALLCNTELPPSTNIDPDRDCKELGISPD